MSKKRDRNNAAEQPKALGSAVNDGGKAREYHGAERKGNCAHGDMTSADKFKDEPELRRAYEALEAEFTRKSQQLAQLSREHEQLLERSREMQVRNERKLALDEFIRRYPKAAEMRAELEESIRESVRDYGQTLSAAYMDILDRDHQSRESLLNDSEFINSCALDERISDAVISRYLKQCYDAPTNIRGGYIPLMKRNKAVTLDQAGEMAKEIYK